MKKEIRKQVRRVMVFLLVMSICAPFAFAKKSEAAKGYKFTYAGETVTIGSKAKKLIKAAGKPNSYSKKKSCAYKGLDRTRQYDDFILGTYSNSKKGAEYVLSITFLTSSIKTKDGIGIGSSKNDMLNAYGTKCTKSNGVYIYTKGKTKLMLQVKNDKVAQIRFVMNKTK